MTPRNIAAGFKEPILLGELIQNCLTIKMEHSFNFKFKSELVAKSSGEKFFPLYSPSRALLEEHLCNPTEVVCHQTSLMISLLASLHLLE